MAIVILLVASTCGCSDDGDDKEEKREQVLDTDGDGYPDDEDLFPNDPAVHDIVLNKTSLPVQSGWVESDSSGGDGGPGYAEASIPIELENKWVVSISVTLKLEDSDETHNETDEGSDPDVVRGKLISEDIEFSNRSGVTPCALFMSHEGNITEQSEEDDGLPRNWYVELTAECYGGKPTGIGPGFQFLTYLDQGVAWELEVEYEYFETI